MSRVNLEPKGDAVIRKNLNPTNRLRAVARAVLAALATLLLAAPLAQRVVAGAALGTGSRLWLEGKSTLHAYESTASRWEVSLVPKEGIAEPADGAAMEELARTEGVRRLEVTVPVAAMKSDKEGLDRNMRKALKADRFPNITVRLDHYDLDPRGDSLAVTASGEITVAGKTRSIELSATGRRTPQGLRIRGWKPLLMSDFDVKPPKMMMGTIRTADQVVIRYDLLLAPMNR